MIVQDTILTLDDLIKRLGLSAKSILELAKTRQLPLRRVTPHADPLCLESEFVTWIKRQPKMGASISQ